MKLPFKKGSKAVPTQTLQDLQKDFNQVVFELGDLNYRKHMINQELAKINSEINTRVQKADAMGVEAARLRTKIQEEVAATAAKGEADALQPQ